jgi:hypothetical protein
MSTIVRLTESSTVNRLRPVKKLLASIVAVVAVLAVAGGIVSLTGPRRAESARETLDRAASRFVQCYARDESYESCETGTSRLMVADRSKRRFALVSAVEFGPTYMISRTAGGKLKRSCQPLGADCPTGAWQGK